MVNKMKTTERVEQAFKRIKELLTLITDWTKQPKETDALTKEFTEKKLEMIEDLYKQLGALSDKYMYSNRKTFSTKEYIVEYGSLCRKG